MTLSVIGTDRRGQAVHQITLSNDRLRVNLWTLGARIQDVRLANVPWSLTAGSDRLADYDGGPLKYFGCLVGPTAGRLKDARAPIAGNIHFWPANDNGNLLHGGNPEHGGWHDQVWDILDASGTTAILQLERSPEQDHFPGKRRLQARFELDGSALRMTLSGDSDAPTLLNPANHSFWTLDGPGGTAATRLKIAATHVLAVRDDVTPLWPPQAVDNRVFDFRRLSPLPAPGTLDHCFCLSEQPQTLRPVAWLAGNKGVKLTLASTEPGLVVFNGWGLNGTPVTGHDGLAYGPGTCIALEPQHWPDAPNLPGAASIEYGPGRPYRQVTEWQFEKRPDND